MLEKETVYGKITKIVGLPVTSHDVHRSFARVGCWDMKVTGNKYTILFLKIPFMCWKRKRFVEKGIHFKIKNFKK